MSGFRSNSQLADRLGEDVVGGFDPVQIGPCRDSIPGERVDQREQMRRRRGYPRVRKERCLRPD